MSEKRYGQASLEAGVPIFMPSAWFLYAAARHGHSAAEMAANFVRQGIVLETSQAYYQVLVLQDTVNAIETQLGAARENAARIEGLAREGFFTAWERDQARLQTEVRQAELDTARRHLEIARADLLVTLGLSPIPAADAKYHLRLSGDTGEPKRPEGTTADLVLTALEGHPMLSIADRQRGDAGACGTPGLHRLPAGAQSHRRQHLDRQRSGRTRLELDDGLRRHMEALQRAGQRSPLQGGKGRAAAERAGARVHVPECHGAGHRRRGASMMP
jgi:multidrug efflux pump subunit AcrA (membrane-fusion protein)